MFSIIFYSSAHLSLLYSIISCYKYIIHMQKWIAKINQLLKSRCTSWRIGSPTSIPKTLNIPHKPFYITTTICNALLSNQISYSFIDIQKSTGLPQLHFYNHRQSFATYFCRKIFGILTVFLLAIKIIYRQVRHYRQARNPNM